MPSTTSLSGGWLSTGGSVFPHPATKPRITANKSSFFILSSPNKSQTCEQSVDADDCPYAGISLFVTLQAAIVHGWTVRSSETGLLSLRFVPLRPFHRGDPALPTLQLRTTGTAEQRQPLPHPEMFFASCPRNSPHRQSNSRSAKKRCRFFDILNVTHNNMMVTP